MASGCTGSVCLLPRLMSPYAGDVPAEDPVDLDELLGRARAVLERTAVLLDLTDRLETRDRDRHRAAGPDPAERALRHRASAAGENVADRRQLVEPVGSRLSVAETGVPLGRVALVVGG